MRNFFIVLVFFSTFHICCGAEDSWETENEYIDQVSGINPLLKESFKMQKSPLNDLSKGVISGIDRVIKQKRFKLWDDPWNLQAIPIYFPSPINGNNIGVRIQMQNLRRQNPEEVSIMAQVLTSDIGRDKHEFNYIQPRAFGGDYKLNVRLAYDRDVNLGYFGIGNNTQVNQNLVNLVDPVYQLTRGGPSFQTLLLRNFLTHWFIGPLFGLKWTYVIAPVGSLLYQQNPVGTSGGRTHYFGGALIRDTRDFEPYPSKGSLNELYFLWASPWLSSDYNFTRTTYTFSYFTRIRRKIILAHRTLFEYLSGNVPFFELCTVGGSYPTLGIGGDRYLRGYYNDRYIDNIRIIFGFELRWDPLNFYIQHQQFTLGFVPFLDIGRVYHTFDNLTEGPWHASTGWGVRLIMDRRLSLRFDIAVQQYGVALIVNLGESF